MSDFGLNTASFTSNETNLGLLNITFQYILAHTQNWSLKITYFVCYSWLKSDTPASAAHNLAGGDVVSGKWKGKLRFAAVVSCQAKFPVMQRAAPNTNSERVTCDVLT